MFSYRVVPSVSEVGAPNWTLYRDYAHPFGTGSFKLAVNDDRSVLEKAIEHLTASPTDVQR
jgi:hypothetical protein